MGPSQADPFEQGLNTVASTTPAPPATAPATNSQDSNLQAIPSHPQPQPQTVPLPYVPTQQPMSSVPGAIGGYGSYGYGGHAPPLYSAGGYGMPSSYGGYSAYNTYGTSYGSPYGGYGYTGTPTRAAALTSANLTTTAATGTAPTTDPSAPQAYQTPQQSSATMMLQEAMARFARVTALVDDVLRHVHMLFDAVFGLAYAVGAARAETAMWLALKQGPVAFLSRVVRAVSSIWRLVALFLLSPMAGRFSPVALVLRILGLVPHDATPITQAQAQQQPLDTAGDEQQQQQQQQQQPAANNDSSSDRDNADNATANANDVNSLFGPWHQSSADGHSFL